MKYACLILAVLMIFSMLLGCSGPSAGDVPTFYYLNAEPEYGSEGSVFGSESRDNAGDNPQLAYLLALYFSGPVDNTLRSPFPNGSAVLLKRTDDASLHLTMNGAFAKLSGIDLTKACACIALTVFSNSEVQTTIIHYTEAATGISKNLEFSRNSLMLQDAVLPDT